MGTKVEVRSGCATMSIVTDCALVATGGSNGITVSVGPDRRTVVEVLDTAYTEPVTEYDVMGAPTLRDWP